ncbi:E3 ubiquitin protein ligase-like protein [Tanacetum coccineum]
MSSICCLECGDDFEDISTNVLYRHCLCLRFFFHQLFTGYGALFQRIEGLPVSSPTQATTSSSTVGFPLSTTNDENQTTTRPLPYDSDHRFPRLQRGLYGALFQRIEGLPVSSPAQATTSSSTVGFPLSTTNDENQTTTRPLPYDSDHRFPRLQRGLVSRREKSVTHFLDDSQSVSELTNRRSGVDLTDQDSKIGNIESLDKSLKVKALEGLLYEQTSDNEDVCPTCLEEYTLENPKIVTKCSHHFHLGCIYEWMERSDTCPMCGKSQVKTTSRPDVTTVSGKYFCLSPNAATKSGF